MGDLQHFANICVLGCCVEKVDMFEMMIAFCVAFLWSSGKFDRFSLDCVIPYSLRKDPRWISFCFGVSIDESAHFSFVYYDAFPKSHTFSFPLSSKQSLAELFQWKQLAEWDDATWLSLLKPLRVLWKTAIKKVFEEI